MVVIRRERSSPPGAAALLAGLLTGCIQPNPLHNDSASADTGTVGTSTDTAGTSTAGTAGTGTASTGTGTATGAATGVSESSTGTTGPAPAICGDAVVDAREACDDGNDDPSDGCVACTIPRTCAEILALAPGSPSGSYLIDLYQTGAPWTATCDMEKDGGGWTGFVVQDTCNGNLKTMVTTLVAAEFEHFEACPFYQYYVDSDTDGGELAYTWDIVFPPTFTAFFLRDYQVAAKFEPELKFQQVTWEMPFVFPDGALSFGDGHAPGPITNWAAAGGPTDMMTDGQAYPYPVQETPFTLDQPTDLLRIGWGEIGVYSEGLYPWWSGQIFVR